MDVGKALLQDAEDRRLYVLRQTSGQGERYVQIELDSAALGEAGGVPAYRRGEARFLELGRVQELRDGANLARSFVHQSFALRK